MLTDRQNRLLKIIVEEYIKTARPVGSNQICKTLKCSSATVRNEMSELEDLELLEKTHTSSGRIPSEAGYRYYVDNLMEPKKMNGEDMLKLQIIFSNQQLELSDYLSKSLEIISDITNYTTIVLGKTSHENKLKEINIVPIDNKNLVVIVVTDKGVVEHKNIMIDANIDEIKKTVNLINDLIVGTPIDEVSTKLEFEIKPIIGRYVKFNKFDSSDIVDKIEEKDNEIKIYIGKESNLDDDMTIIKTSYKTNKQDGTIAIVGPKRMDYERVVSLLEYIKEHIEM